MTPGKLFLIPTNLSEPVQAGAILPPQVSATALGLNHFIAENAKTARGFLKAIGIARPLQDVSIVQLDKHHSGRGSADLLAPLLAGHDVGLVSEAGAPGVADPGAEIVAMAHANGIRVVPLVGPSSILLGLMASGLNGQRFAFHGYLPVDKPERTKMIAELERESRQKNMTQLFIETPYRNSPLLEDLLAVLDKGTRLAIASDLTGPDEVIISRSVATWKSNPVLLPRVPALFMFLAQ